MKLLKWIWHNILFLATLFLLAFIPLYPKRPLLDVMHTWVYIRVEDFVVGLIILLWIFLLLFKKVTLKTPLTLPILLFWIIGGLSTLHGVLILFPTLSNVFSNVAFLSFLRRIEYISLFFIAYASIKDKKYISYVVSALVVVLLLIVGYGFGQKFLGFPAYLTMNEEFAKGVPIQLSQLSRVPSTFAGHYDLAAYLVLIIPLLVSMVFGLKNWFLRILLLVSVGLGFALLFMTVSRVSFFVLFLSLVLLLFLQKKRILIISLGVLTLIFLSIFPTLMQRFGSTVSEVSVLVDTQTGEAIGHVKEVPSAYFENKIVKKKPISDEDAKQASSTAVLPFILIPKRAVLVVETNSPTGENLPQGTSYINLPLSPIVEKVSMYFSERSKNKGDANSTEIMVYYGDYIIKRAKAYDLSFTTRFQGEWPRTIDAFKRNIFFGSGYGSVSLAVDNNYLRILGESGLFGFISFLSIFVIAGVYIKKVLPKVDSPIIRSFVLGFVAGTFGLVLNAVLIDVFEASKIAFLYWMLMGITLGLLQLYKNEEIDFLREFKKVMGSTYAVVIYLLVIIISQFSSATNYYFVGDDFTWLRWVSDCYQKVQTCQPLAVAIRYFTQADGFFYRPGTKIYFSFMYWAFWLNQTMYHMVSIFLHFSVSVLLFLIAKRVLKSHFLAAASALLFLILSGNHEAIFWISSTGFLFNAVFSLLSLLFFIYWKERKKTIYFVVSLISIVCSLLFHEVGVIVPLLVIVYDVVMEQKTVSTISRKSYYLLLLSPLMPYFILRAIAQSHWFNGDYSYNLLKLPFNMIGNIIGYIMLGLLGPASTPLYGAIRNASKEHMLFALPVTVVILYALVVLYRRCIQKMAKEEQKIVIFGTLFFTVSLLPFLGLGNITSRYSYLSSLGFIFLFVFFLKKGYDYLLFNGKNIALLTIIIITIIFSSLHLFQFQRIQTDWQESGERSKKFLISLYQFYVDDGTKKTFKFHFVNVPIRNGEAWVFPVGLSDAVWFAFRNEHIKISQFSSLDAALNSIVDPLSEKVFEFNSDGTVIQKRKLQNNI